MIFGEKKSFSDGAKENDAELSVHKSVLGDMHHRN